MRRWSNGDCFTINYISALRAGTLELSGFHNIFIQKRERLNHFVHTRYFAKNQISKNASVSSFQRRTPFFKI